MRPSRSRCSLTVLESTSGCRSQALNVRKAFGYWLVEPYPPTVIPQAALAPPYADLVSAAVDELAQ